MTSPHNFCIGENPYDGNCVIHRENPYGENPVSHRAKTPMKEFSPSPIYLKIYVSRALAPLVRGLWSRPWTKGRASQAQKNSLARAHVRGQA